MKSEKTGGDHGKADGKIGSCAYMDRHDLLHILCINNFYMYHDLMDERNIRTK